MKNLRTRFERFCYRNRTKGIPNLMLYLVLGAILVYVVNMSSNSNALYYALCFDRDAILHGQIWRLVTYPLTFSAGGVFFTVIAMYCFYSLGRALEMVWGSLKFNIYLLSGILLMDIYAMIFNCQADVLYIYLALLLGYATLNPQARFLVFFIIPVPAWIFAVLYIGMVFYSLFFDYFPYNLFPLIALANYFLFFGKDVRYVIPESCRLWFSRTFSRRKKPVRTAKTIPFTPTAAKSVNYTHKCTVCGRTDVSDPGLEFRYCSRCNGYYCYCAEHISNHEHIQ